MIPHWLRILALVAALIPSAWFAWQYRQMPNIGDQHDDALYYVGAKSLATGQGYKILSLPNEPYQTKYPPLWPLMLSTAWLIEPRYPNNLPIAMFLCWIGIPITLFLYRKWLTGLNLNDNLILGLGVVWALNPYLFFFGTIMLSELPFTALLLLTLLSLHGEEPPLRRSVLAGVLAGLTFLTRTAGIALLPAVVGWMLVRRQYRAAGSFGLAMLPFIAGWGIWSGQHRSPDTGWTTLYYTNYLGYHLANFKWDEAHVFFWRNLDGILLGLGAWAMPSISTSLPEKILAQTFAVGGIVGIVRRVRMDWRSTFTVYALFGLIYTAMLVTWSFPPTERFMMPLVPLWLLGFWSEIVLLAANIRAVFRKPDVGQRVVGGGFGFVVALLVAYCAYAQWQTLTARLPEYYSDRQRRLEETEPVIKWMRNNLPPEATVMNDVDPVVYLQTGLRGESTLTLSPTLDWYREDNAAMLMKYSDAPAYAKRDGIDYILLSDWDYVRLSDPLDHAKLIQRLREDQRMELLFRSGRTGIYRVK